MKIWGGGCEKRDISRRQYVATIVCFEYGTIVLDTFYEWGKKDYKLNHLLYMDDLKLFAKSEEQIDTLVRTVLVFSTDIGMEFRMKKYGTITMKRGKVVRSEGVILPNNEEMKEVEKEGYKYLGIV